MITFWFSMTHYEVKNRIGRFILADLKLEKYVLYYTDRKQSI